MNYQLSEPDYQKLWQLQKNTKVSRRRYRRVTVLVMFHQGFVLADTINAQSTQHLCRKLPKKHPGKTIHLISDNARYSRCGWLQGWAADQRFGFLFLPPYSPNLNLIERLWRSLRKAVMDSTYSPIYDRFRSRVTDFLADTKTYKEEIRSLLTLNF